MYVQLTMALDRAKRTPMRAETKNILRKLSSDIRRTMPGLCSVVSVACSSMVLERGVSMIDA